MNQLLIIGDPTGVHSMIALKKYDANNIWVWENDPRHIYTIRQIDGRINIITDLDECNDMKFDVVIGNPPYGSGANLAIKFVNKSAELSDDIRMVLPLSFKKVSVQNKVRLDLICIEERVLPEDTFPNGIRAVYQRWVKTDVARQKVDTFTTHSDFEFVSKEEANLCIGRVGGGPSGRVYLSDWEERSTNTHYYLKCKSPEIIQNFLDIADELRSVGKGGGNNIPTLSKHELISVYVERFGRSKIEKPRTHEDFEFLRYDDRHRANVFVGEYGAGPSGRVKTENFTHYAKGHYFILAKNQEVIDKLVACGPEFRALASNCNGRFHISKGELVEIYTNHGK